MLDSEASFLDLRLFISACLLRLNFMINEATFILKLCVLPFLDISVPHSVSCGVCVSQFIRFTRLSSHGDDFDTRYKV